MSDKEKQQVIILIEDQSFTDIPEPEPTQNPPIEVTDHSA